jgi:hypothetical protein
MWTVHSSYVRCSFVFTHLFMSVTCSFFVVIQPSVCLPLSLSVTTNYFDTYDQCDSCPIWRFLFALICRARFLLENSSFYIFILLWGFLPVPVIMHHFSHTLCVLAIYRAPAGDFEQFISNLDCIINYLHKPRAEFIICGDVNTYFLIESHHKQCLVSLLTSLISH